MTLKNNDLTEVVIKEQALIILAKLDHLLESSLPQTFSNLGIRGKKTA
ncbi:hypothetical protein KR50_04240 [Jeotgalibacillus campisalis]|uniref:Uncharacterized protein n=1 Tax=Jeotgalibacillus campisalis TaxID=220754 RepID=A0A0C2RS87_9BACL|nr:hypothetical protein KR50_04240 [Jeotgalibacillus campisalis]